MSTKSRGDRIQLLVKAVSKHFSPVDAPDDRTVLEHLLYACCLEDASYEAADEAFLRLQQSYFDWNEVRVTTVSELRESLHNLPDPTAAAVRVKRNLQSLFETRYSFDLDDLLRMNQGKAVQELQRMNGMSRFVLAYVTQNGLGGHAIPLSKTILNVLRATDVISEAEAERWQAPGLERSVPKSKGRAFASNLHQFAVALAASPNSKQLKTVLKEAGATEKKPAKKPTKSAKKAPAKEAKKPASTKKAAASKSPKKAGATKKPAEKKTADKKSAGKTKASAKKSSAKTSAKKRTKRKPR